MHLSTMAESFNTALPLMKMRQKRIYDGLLQISADFEVGDAPSYQRCKHRGGNNCDGLYSRYRVETTYGAVDLETGYMVRANLGDNLVPTKVTFLEIEFYKFDTSNRLEIDSITGTGHQFKVLSTVISNTISLADRFNVDVLAFAARSSEMSRVALYKKLIQRVTAVTRYRYDLSDHYRRFFEVGTDYVDFCLGTDRAVHKLKMRNQ